MDIFDKIQKNRGPLGQYSSIAHGYFSFPKLEGEISNKMIFRGKEVLVWSINNYLGLSNHPEVRQADAESSKKYGLGTPMGARIMSGNTTLHEKLEAELASYVSKEDTILLNYGYQGMISAIDALIGRNDVVVYDSEAHACIVDGLRMHLGKRFVFPHNNIEKLETCLKRATRLTKETGGGIMVITEGVFGMSGDQGKIKEIVALKDEFSFRLFVDDAHGIGTMGATGAGIGEEQGVQDGIDLYFGTFAKSFASIGAFIGANEQVCEYLRYNSRSQVFAKSIPMPLVEGTLKRLELMRRDTVLKDKLWTIVNALQNGLRKEGFDLGATNSPVTPVYMHGAPLQAANVVLDLRENFGIFCSIVVYPVVPKGVIMLRLIPTSIHTMEDVNYTINTFKYIQEKLKAGEYSADKVVIS